MFLVPKKDGSYRPVIDFRRVNDVTVGDHFPLPVLRDLLMCLGRGNKIFTSLATGSCLWPLSPVNNGFQHTSWPLLVDEDAFWTMNNIFGDLLGNSVYVYLDDIIIASKDVQAHMTTLKAVLHRLQEVGLKIKLTKGRRWRDRQRTGLAFKTTRAQSPPGTTKLGFFGRRRVA